jgi:hypothetical protein
MDEIQAGQIAKAYVLGLNRSRRTAFELEFQPVEETSGWVFTIVSPAHQPQLVERILVERLNGNILHLEIPNAKPGFTKNLNDGPITRLVKFFGPK